MTERLVSMLRASDLRVTRQRQLVWEVLQQSHEHLDAEAVHTCAKARDPNISLATVYRTLATLKEVGLVEEHRLGEEHAHFEIVPQTPHYHFTCQACGCIIEFDAPQVMQAVRELSKREDLLIQHVHLFLNGLCSQCQHQQEG
ncbi:MAG: transcriptional repressor [Anaerolineae bacterium]|nr:transcriptional repressor [Anaerolineae bacterium]